MLESKCQILSKYVIIRKKRIYIPLEAHAMDSVKEQLCWIEKCEQERFDNYIEAYNKLAECVDIETLNLIDNLLQKHTLYLVNTG